MKIGAFISLLEKARANGFRPNVDSNGRIILRREPFGTNFCPLTAAHFIWADTASPVAYGEACWPFCGEAMGLKKKMENIQQASDRTDGPKNLRKRILKALELKEVT